MTANRYDQAALAYIEEAASSESRLSLIARLYEMAQLQVARAQAGLAAGDPMAKGMAVHRASSCIGLLQRNLDMRRGGDVARNLDRLYTYFLARLTEAHLNHDGEALTEISNHLSELGAAWRTVADRQEGPAAEGARQAEGATAAVST